VLAGARGLDGGVEGQQVGLAPSLGGSIGEIHSRLQLFLYD
jgi:hypothetical protein